MNMESIPSELYVQYIGIKEYMERYCQNRIYSDNEFYLQIKDLYNFLSFEYIMELSYLFFKYYVNDDKSLIGTLEDIKDNQMLCDDSPFEDIVLYHHSVIFLDMTLMSEYYDEIIQQMIQFGSFYDYFIYHKNQIEENNLNETFTNLSMK